MKYYKSYTAKKLKLPRRILFFIIVAAVIFVFSVILGNNLKKRLADTDINTDPVETVDLENIKKEQNESGGNAVHETGKYCAGYLALDGEDDTASANSAVSKLKGEGYTAVAFAVTDESGLRYASPAMTELSRLPASEKIVGFDVLSGAISYGKSIGMRTSAVFAKSGGESDFLIINELCKMGFDEIIICGFEDSLGENGGDITEAVAYLERVCQVADCEIALALKPQAYTFARNSYHIEKLFTYTEFLAVDLTLSTAEDAAALADGFAGSFSAYSLRALITAEQTDVAESLDSAELRVYQYVTQAPEQNGDTADAENG